MILEVEEKSFPKGYAYLFEKEKILITIEENLFVKDILDNKITILLESVVNHSKEKIERILKIFFKIKKIKIIKNYVRKIYLPFPGYYNSFEQMSEDNFKENIFFNFSNIYKNNYYNMMTENVSFSSMIFEILNKNIK